MLVTSSVPCVRGTAVFGLKAATEELWGDLGLRDVAYRLPRIPRRALMEEIVMPQAWIPESHLIDFCRCVWEGPAQQVESAYTGFLGRAAFHGFGRFQKIILSFTSPEAIAVRVPSLWRRDHTHGELEADVTRNGCVMSVP